MSNQEQNLVLSAYLSNLENLPLLTRNQEDTLVDGMVKAQEQVLDDCVVSSFFRSELLEVLVKAVSSTDWLLKSSRAITEDSSKDEREALQKVYNVLVTELDKAAPKVALVRDLLLELKLNGALVSKVINRVRKKYEVIEEADEKLNSLLKLLNVKTEEELSEAVDKIKSDAVARELDATSSSDRIHFVAHEHGEYQEKLKKLERLGIELDQLKEIRKCFKSITRNEIQLKHYRDQLVNGNLRLVVFRAKRYTNRGVDFEDLIQEGNIGLIKAINKHDPSRGVKVATHATWWIDQSIRRAISNKGRNVRIPNHVEFIINQIEGARKSLKIQLGRTPSKEEILSHTDVSERDYDKIQTLSLKEVSLDHSWEQDGGSSLLDIIADRDAESPFQEVARSLLREQVRKVISELKPQHQKIIRLRFGIGEEAPKTLEEIGQEIGITKQGVRVIEQKALDRLRKKKGL